MGDRYIRFVVAEKDDVSGRRLGIFQPLFDLSDNGDLYEYQETFFRESVKWFNDNLKEPTSLRRSSKYHTENKAISWFKDGATVHIRHMRDLAAILEEHGVTVEVIQTERPGYVVYEDAFQVTAEPFSDSGA